METAQGTYDGVATAEEVTTSTDDVSDLASPANWWTEFLWRNNTRSCVPEYLETVGPLPGCPRFIPLVRYSPVSASNGSFSRCARSHELQLSRNFHLVTLWPPMEQGIVCVYHLDQCPYIEESKQRSANQYI